jgi:hypothetical protein
MKLFVVAALAGMVSTAAQACTLSDDDFKALAVSPSHIAPSEFPHLQASQQKSICDTRTFIAHIDAQNGVIKEIEPYSTKYLSPAENKRVVAASNAFLENLLKSKGYR